MKPLKEVIASLQANKRLGQNFLIDPAILLRIVKAAEPFEGRTLIEVGAGPGGLSRELINVPCKAVILIEKDPRCIPELRALEEATSLPLTVEQADATTLPLHTYGTPPRKIIANLPYNVSVPLLLQWLKHITHFESLTLMFQKEVAERLFAKPNSSAYGRLSVMCQTYANIEKLFDLPPGAFIPPPKVRSTIVRLTPVSPHPTVPWDTLEFIVKAAFEKRRKMLRSSLKGIFTPLELEDLGISPTHRAEDLSLKEFSLLAHSWKRLPTP